MADRYYVRSNTIIDREDKLNNMERILSPSEACERLNDLNDEYHTMQELYDFRLMYNALLFNEWTKREDIEVYKSRRHYDNELCFDGDWFIVVAILPDGKQISNHYHIDYWDYFNIPSYPKMKDKFDGHTSQDVLNRLKEML